MAATKRRVRCRLVSSRPLCGRLTRGGKEVLGDGCWFKDGGIARVNDHLTRLGYAIREDPNGSRVLLLQRSVLFRNLGAAETARVIDEAMKKVIPWLDANVSASGLAIEQRHIEEVALRVVLSWLYMYNLWRSLYPEHRNHPLTVGSHELRQAQTFDQCYDYCKHVFGADFRRYVAALLGLTAANYANVEKRRQEYWNK